MASYNVDSLPQITNLLNIEDMYNAFGGQTIQDGVITFRIMIYDVHRQSTVTPIANHKYYLRCLQKRTADSKISKVFFAFGSVYDDETGSGIQSIDFIDIDIQNDNKWYTTSEIKTTPDPIKGENWNFSITSYNMESGEYQLKDFVLIDLTEAFGAGNEPSKLWCDKNIPFFTGTITIVPPTLSNGDIINCAYSGSEKSVTLMQGKYKLECWGAMGGHAYNSSHGWRYGGIGGYTVGNTSLDDTSTFYLNCGGKGTDVNSSSSSDKTYSGGYNGGGNGYHTSIVGFDGNCGSGGGATHIAIISGVLPSFDSRRENVIAVAGGGGAACVQGILHNGAGYRGGGLSGEGGSASTSGKGGTQTAGGDANASFGQGSNGGGGGWYGGGAGGVGDYCGSGGGSGYISSSLDNASTTIQSASTNPDSSENGFIRITVIDNSYLDIPVNIHGSYKNTDKMCACVNGVYKVIESITAHINGIWKRLY